MSAEVHPHVRASTRPGHLRTLIASFLHFDLSFMLWVLLGALGIYIAESVGLGPAEKGLMVAVPILSGSLLRIPLALVRSLATTREDWRFSWRLPTPAVLEPEVRTA